jgi:hypothetical protein
MAPMPMNAWLRHVAAALDPVLEDGWLELLGRRDAAANESTGRRVEAGPDRRTGPDDTMVVPLPRSLVSHPRLRH